jgi:cytochrome c-type biogenesis protein CcmH/NrfG
MNQLDRLISDVTSWYWWLSIVLVGLAINLVSAYLKPLLDAYLDRRSASRREVRRQKEETFDKQTSLIANDPTSLLLAGQSAKHTEVRYYLEKVVTGIHLILLYATSSNLTTLSPLAKFVALGLALLLPFQLLSMLGAMRKRFAEQDKFEVALEKSGRAHEA